MEKVFKAWKNLQVLVKARAVPLGGTDDLRAFIPNLTMLRDRNPNVLRRKHLLRATKLRENIRHFRQDPQSLTATAYRGFVISAGHLARTISSIEIVQQQVIAEGI